MYPALRKGPWGVERSLVPLRANRRRNLALPMIPCEGPGYEAMFSRDPVRNEGGGIDQKKKMRFSFSVVTFSLKADTDTYRKIPTISPGLTFVRKAFCWAYFWRGLFTGGIVRFKMGLAVNKSSSKRLTETVYGHMCGRDYHQKDICIGDLGGS